MNQQIKANWWLIALSIAAGVAGQTAMKFGVTQPDGAVANSGLLQLINLIIGSPFVLLGLLLYVVGALAWIALLSRMDLSLAYPFLALNFVLITLVSYLALGETIPTTRWLGIAVICGGILLIARSTS